MVLVIGKSDFNIQKIDSIQNQMILKKRSKRSAARIISASKVYIRNCMVIQVNQGGGGWVIGR